MAQHGIGLDAWINGAWVSGSALAVSVHDAGFIHGVTVAEQLRTFAGRPFRRKITFSG